MAVNSIGIGINSELTRIRNGTAINPPPKPSTPPITAATANRTIPYFDKEIVPDLQKGRNVLVSAHGNSLRSIVMHIEPISPDEIVSLEIPTGSPMYYVFQDGEVTRIE